MYRALLYVVILAVASADVDEKCMRIFRPDIARCCMTLPPTSFEDINMKECIGLPMEPFSTCERATCMANKAGLATPDGVLDKKAIVEFLEKKGANNPELVKLIKEKCVDGDINAYAPKDFCDVMKFRNCMHLQFLTQCKEFSDEGDCSNTGALVKECAGKF